MAQFNENIELLNVSGITVQLTNEQSGIIAGGNGTPGVLRLYNAADDNTNPAQATVTLNASQALVSAGGQGVEGAVALQNGTGENRITLNGTNASVNIGGNGAQGNTYLYRNNGDNITPAMATVQINGQEANIFLGGNGADGDLVLKDATNNNRIRLDAGESNLWMGGNGADGDIVLFKTDGDNETPDVGTIHLNAGSGDMRLGGNGVSGDITLRGNNNQNRVRLQGNANLWLGGNGADGDIVMFQSDRDNQTLEQASIHLDGQAADLRMGNRGAQGDITLRSRENQNRARLLGDGNLWLGGNGADGDIVIFRTNGDNQTLEQASIHLDGEAGNINLKGTNNLNRVRLEGGGGNIWLGGNGADGDLVLFKSDGDNATLENASIHLNGDSGNIRCNDVIIPGADFAEDFDIHQSVVNTLEPGTVMVLGRNGKLHESTQAFDRKVAGVVSGAGKYKPGITLDKQPGLEHRMPIALSGKVMCKVDASYGSIEVGDLITTSPRKGYAMKADDPYKAFGAVIGKALADFPDGDGMLPILVALQ